MKVPSLQEERALALVRAENWQELAAYVSDKVIRDPIYTDYLLMLAHRRLKNTEALTCGLRAANGVKLLLEKKNIVYPEGALVCAEFGDMCLTIQEWKLAKKFLTLAIHLPIPEAVATEVMAKLGWALANLNQTNDSVEALKLARSLALQNPTSITPVYRYCAATLEMWGEFDGALDVLDGLPETDAVLLDRANLYGSCGEFKKTLECMVKASPSSLNRLDLPNPVSKEIIDSFFIPPDQGFGDMVCLLPYLHKLEGKDVTWVLPEAQLGLIKSLAPSFIKFTTDVPENLPFIPSALLLFLLGGSNDEPHQPIIQHTVDPYAPVGISFESNMLFAGDTRRRPDNKTVADILARYPNHIRLDHSIIKTGTWLETLEELKKCSRLISLDTGLTHLACAVGIPTTTIVRVGHDWRYANETPYWAVQTLAEQKQFGDWSSILDIL